MVAYVEYVAGTAKGQTEQGHLFNSPFKLGDVDGEYTADRITDTVAAGADYIPAWTPVVKGAFTTIVVNTVEVEFDPRAEYTAAEKATIAQKDYKSIAAADNSITFGNFTGTGTDADPYKIASASVVAGRVAYMYDNIIIPQEKLPTLKAEIKSIPLLAKARRIAVYYSQIAAFQAKTDYGFDLGDQLAEKAVGQLSYEIDTEVVNLLDEVATANFSALDAAGQAELTWSKTLPVGVSKREHYAGFAEVLEIARQRIYDATKKFAPNYMICASNILPVLSMMDSFEAAPAGAINGPYLAGTIGSLKVFISPAMAPGKFAVGVNGNDMMSAVAVYAPYLPIVPTQLLQFADGATSQGFSTMYDLVKLNDALIIGGEIVA